MEREFRAERGSVLFFGALTLLMTAALFVADASASAALALAGWIVSSGYQVVLALRTRVVVDEQTVTVRWAIRSASFDRSDLVAHRRRRRAIRVDVVVEGARRTIRLPAVADTDALEQAVRGSTTDLPRSEHGDLVIHQGGLVRRWGAPTYVVTS